jgi:uncharacterized protein with HEPN domain
MTQPDRANVDEERLRLMLRLARELEALGPHSIDRATSHLSALAGSAREAGPRLRAAHGDIPWMVLSTIGQVLSRMPDDLYSPEILATIREDIPELRRRLDALLQALD